jgi:hypothetical protein
MDPTSIFVRVPIAEMLAPPFAPEVRVTINEYGSRFVVPFKTTSATTEM